MVHRFTHQVLGGLWSKLRGFQFRVLGCSRIWNETWLTPFFFKPCNYELFVKQSLNMEMAIVLARVGEGGGNLFA